MARGSSLAFPYVHKQIKVTRSPQPQSGFHTTKQFFLNIQRVSGTIDLPFATAFNVF
jgi:hypothetical protein